MLGRTLERMREERETRSALDCVDCMRRVNDVSVMGVSKTARRREDRSIHKKKKRGSDRNVPGVTKLSSGASSGMMAFGRTNAPVDISCTSGVEGEDGRDASTTFAKWVGTAMLGGEPMTS